MGNRPKVANKPFTVIVKLGVIRSANINKDDMMADLGYDDHLQTSRLIVAGVRKDRKLTGEKLASIIDFLSARLSEEETSEETEERLMRLEKTLKAHLQRASRCRGSSGPLPSLMACPSCSSDQRTSPPHVPQP